MRSYLFLPSFVLCLVLLYMPASGISEGSPGDISATIPESQSQIVKLTDKGLEPATLEMRTEDGVAFFLNDTTDSLITLDVAANGVKTHCASGNMKIDDNGTIRSNAPIVPKDFASTCFHKPGTYQFTVYGLPNHTEGVKGSIIVR
jgi:hypothetical protein